MSRRLDVGFLEATVLRRTRRGGVAQREGQWLYRGRPMPEGMLLVLYEVLAEDGLLQVGAADEDGLRRVRLSEAGQVRYRQLCSSPQAGLRVPRAGHAFGDTTEEGPRRGWCVPSCGCIQDIAVGGAVYVTDCPACEPAGGQAPTSGWGQSR